MKFKFIFPTFFLFSVLFSNYTFSQDSENEFEPVFIFITTLHGAENVDRDDWLSVEEEYFEKVTNKNELILHHEILVNYYTPQLSELKIVYVVKTWDGLKKVREIREELINKAWPNEDDRKAFFEKQNSFYSNFHSDEIYISTNYAKELSDEFINKNDEPLIYFVNTNILTDHDHDVEKSYGNYIDYIQKIIHKNPYIKAYYPYRHFIGADSREFVEVFVVNSLTDLDKAIHTNKEMLKKLIPDDKKREEYLKAYGLEIASQSNEIFVNVPSLSK
jgi:hypothetical protein